MSKEILDLDYFIAGVPPYALFSMDHGALAQVVASLTSEEDIASQKILEISYIGLVAYFEAFCKNLFAANVNICPSLLNDFCNKRGSVTVNILDVLRIENKLSYRLGSLLSENFDFGSPKSINALFRDLIGITPFTKKEASRFSNILNDRNLLVHHGGVYTFKYHGQKTKVKAIEELVHWHSISISKADFLRDADFINKVALKMTKACNAALLETVKKYNLVLDEQHRKAIDYLLMII